MPQGTPAETSLYYLDEKGRYGLSAFITKLNLKTSSQCRNYYLKNLKKNGVQATKKKHKKLLLLETFTKEFQGKEINAKNINAYLRKGSYCIDVHLSAMHYTNADDDWFESLLDSVRVRSGKRGLEIKISNPQTSSEYASVATKYFSDKDYANAIANYRKAINLNRQNHDLDPVQFVIAVDNLGMAYGITKDYDRAKSNYEYGLSVFLDYPMFHYNLACVYAETGKTDLAVNSLNKAYMYRKNNLPGELLPDPIADTSFASILEDLYFKKIAEKIREYRADTIQ